MASFRAAAVNTYVETERMALRRFTRADVDNLVALHGYPSVMRRIDNGRPAPRAVVEQRQLPDILREYDELPVSQVLRRVLRGGFGVGGGLGRGCFGP